MTLPPVPDVRARPGLPLAAGRGRGGPGSPEVQRPSTVELTTHPHHCSTSGVDSPKPIVPVLVCRAERWRNPPIPRSKQDPITSFFKRVAHKYTRDLHNWKALKRLLALRPFCAYTGVPLEIRRNASLDHILPRSRGGGDELANLQWVDMDVNRMKGSLTHEEFIEVCHVIAARFPR